MTAAYRTRKSVLGIDVGTSTTKALCCSTSGEMIATAQITYPTHVGKGGRAEQQPEDWIAAVVTCLREIARQARSAWPPDAVSITGQMHGLVLLDDRGRVLRPCLICSDSRATEELGIILRRLSRRRILEITGSPPLPVFPGPKMLWIKNNEPQIYQRIRKVMFPKDYVGYVMTGQWATDPSDASGSMLYDFRSRTWNDILGEACGVPADVLPPIRACEEIRGTVGAEFARQSGLSIGTPVIVGGGDLPMTVLGCGITNPSTAGLSLGTAGIVFRLVVDGSLEPSGNLFTFAHADADFQVRMGSCPAAGFSLNWFETSVLGRQPDFERINYSQAEDRLAEKPTLFFLPFLLGTGSPYMNYQVRAGFIGLSPHHNTRQLRLAILEGICYSLRHSLSYLQGECSAIERAMVCGGGTKNETWLHVLSGVIDLPLNCVATRDVAVLGAQRIRLVGQRACSR